ncbi:MAG: carboxypeptidase-like regulatory domain-containing protein [Holophagales bacterium]|nr:carboxypeptidase-like regulatory domain-containing protein [Holophagales bacterium]
MRNFARQLLFALTLLPLATPGWAREAVLVQGTVQDAAGQPLENVAVQQVDTDLSAVVTDAAGRFRFLASTDSAERRISFSMPGYGDVVASIDGSGELDVVLHRSDLRVCLEGFESGGLLRGSVHGLAPGHHQALKVLVYVLTDSWYIHPEATNEPDRSFALVDEAGRWQLATIRRQHQATKLAVLVVPRHFLAPSVLGARASVEETLRRLSPLAYAVYDAPEGI